MIRAVRAAAAPPMTSPGPARGLCSRTKRWVARSAEAQPAHRVGASGPTRRKRSHSSARSARWGGEGGIGAGRYDRGGARSTTRPLPSTPVIPERFQPLVEATAALARLFEDAGYRLYLVGG